MATYGIIIGIKEYQDPGVPTLSTPVEDALRMVAWLVTKGRVPVGNLLVLLSPIVKTVDPSMTQLAQTLVELKITTADFEKTLGRLDAFGNLRRAVREEILQALLDVDEKAPNGGDRVYFYYAGHGLASQISFATEDAIVPANYRDPITRAISVSSVVHYLQSLKFPEQLLFLDCCRNLTIQQQSLDMAPVPKPLDLSSPVPDQFIYNATAPGLKALDGRGLLTDALLDGLLGKGSAVDWVSQSKSYVVRAVQLFDYIRERYRNRPQAAVVGKNQIQVPRLSGEHDQEPVVVTLPETDLSPVALTLHISPDDVRPIKKVTLLSSGAEVDHPDVTQGPLTLTLMPRTYLLKVETDPRWLPGGDPCPWELKVYDPLEYPVKFVPNPAQVVVAPRPQPRNQGGPFGFAPRSIGAKTASAGGAGPGPRVEAAPMPEPGSPGFGHLVVSSDDPIAIIEVVDESGAPVIGADGQSLMGLSPLDCPGLKPGHYRARLKTPNGLVGEKTVMAEDGQIVRVKLTVPVRQLTGLIGAVADRFQSLPDGDVFTNRVLASAEPTLMTVLTLANEAIQRSRSGKAQADPGPTRGIGPVAAKVPPADSKASPLVDATLGSVGQGIVVVLAAEMVPASLPTGDQIGPAGEDRLDSPLKVEAYLRSISLGFGLFDHGLGAAQVPAMTSTPGIAGLAFPAEPGACWLSVRATTPGSQQRVAFALFSLKGRTTRLLLHQEADGRIHALQFLPSFVPEGPTSLDLVRRLDLAQQFLIQGKLGEMAATLEPMLDVANPDQLDPVAGCLAGHLLIRTAGVDRLKTIGDRMLGLYPDLPDSHVLRAFHRDATGQATEAVASYSAALDRGFPITAQLCSRLADGVARWKIQHPRVELLQRIVARLVPGGLWTAWSPDLAWDGSPATAQGPDPMPASKP